MSKEIATLCDVIEVQFAKPHAVRVIATGKTTKNAEAIVDMAVMRRGCAESYFTTCKAALYKDGDWLKENMT